jgi:uncharacterized protein YbjT (DUF2867 family)
MEKESMSHSDKTILVFGATGQQGGAVARHLRARGWHVRALVRDPHQASAQALEDQGVELVQGDLDQPASLRAAMKGVYGVFSVQTPFTPGGVEAEERQGKAVADAAKATGVSHFVYSSVGGAERETGIAHFESKWRIEQYIRTLDLPVTILRPVFFMDNFLRYGMATQEEGTVTITMALQPETALQFIAADDIGAFAALVFEQKEKFLGKEIEIAGDELTPSEIAETFQRVTGKQTRFVELPVEQLRSFDPESGNMFAWFNESGYQADLLDLRQIHPHVKNLETWLKEAGQSDSAGEKENP